MLICAMYLVDIGEDKWTYALQYAGRIFHVDSPEPWDALSVADKEDLMQDAFAFAFEYHRSVALSKRPEDVMEEEMLKRGIEAMEEAEEFDPEADVEEEEDLSDFTTEELWDELEKRRKENEKQDPQ